MIRRPFVWKLKARELKLGETTLIMGVLNVTPDSFSDGGKYADPDRAFARAVEMEEQGADIIDVGAESTRPGSTQISAAEEIRRLIPVLKRLRGKLNVPISVDTYKAEVAELQHQLETEQVKAQKSTSPKSSKRSRNGRNKTLRNATQLEFTRPRRRPCGSNATRFFMVELTLRSR